MNQSRRILLAAAAVFACQKRRAPAPGPAEDTAAFAESVIAGSRRLFPNPLLTTHGGRPVRLYDDFVRGRFLLLNFAYTRCEGKCPRGLSVLLAMRKLLTPRLGSEPDLVTLTLDPEHDSPDVLGRYVASRGAPAGWTCVTGDAGDLDRVRRFLGFTDPDPRVDADRSQHGSLVAMGDDLRGRWQVASTQAGAEPLALLALRTAGIAPVALRARGG
jgi:cytochrome oxidase Cu insertion factor (SCO1/SenC/PrrC family)